MERMKYSIQQQGNRDTNRFKNYIIALGVCLSFLTFTSFNNWNQSSPVINDQNEVGLQMDDKTNQQESKEALTDNGSKPVVNSHHNFIASFLLQESSIKRTSNREKELKGVFSSIKQLHKLIITKTLGAI